MSRYINYDAIDYRNDRLVKASDDFIKGVEYANSCINNAPSIDIVRCKECRWYDSGQNESDSWNYCTRHFGHYIDVNDDDFCSYGEPKGESDE